MKPLSSKLMKKFLTVAGEQLKGEWLLIGGTVLPILGIDLRVTTDIDLIPLNSKFSNSSVLELMKLAEKLDLPIEAINHAGLYFLEKISDYRDCLVILHKGNSATIYRPDVNLFLRLKMARLTESDLQDCLEFLKYAQRVGEKLNLESFHREYKKEFARSKVDKEKRARLEKLNLAATSQGL